MRDKFCKKSALRLTKGNLKTKNLTQLKTALKIQIC